MTSELVESLLDGLMATVTLVIMFILAPDMALLVLVGACVYAAIRWASFAQLRETSAEAIVWAARRDSHFLETVRGIRTIKLFNGQADRRVTWLNLLVETINRQLTVERLRILFQDRQPALARRARHPDCLARRAPRARWWVFGRAALRIHQLQGPVPQPCQRVDQQGGRSHHASAA